MPKVREITRGLQFPEGPVAMADGSVLVVEIARRCVTRVQPRRRQGGGGDAGRRAERAGHRP